MRRRGISRVCISAAAIVVAVVGIHHLQRGSGHGCHGTIWIQLLPRELFRDLVDCLATRHPDSLDLDASLECPGSEGDFGRAVQHGVFFDGVRWFFGFNGCFGLFHLSSFVEEHAERVEEYYSLQAVVSVGAFSRG